MGQRSVLESLEKKGQIKRIYTSYIEEWKPENACQEMTMFLNLTDVRPDVIISSSERLTTGILQAIKNNPNEAKKKYIITGMDPDKATIDRLKDSTQTISVYKPFRKLAYKAAEISYKFATGQKIESTSETLNNGLIDVPVLYLDPIVVDKNNIVETLVKDGYYSKEELSKY